MISSQPIVKVSSGRRPLSINAAKANSLNLFRSSERGCFKFWQSMMWKIGLLNRSLHVFSIRLVHKTATPLITYKPSVELLMRPLPPLPEELRIDKRVMLCASAVYIPGMRERINPSGLEIDSVPFETDLSRNGAR
jgi:hypothetical protein